MSHLVYILMGHVAAKRLVQLHQVLVYRFRLLPLLEYIDAVVPVMDALEKDGFFIRDSVRQMVTEQAGE